MVTFSGSVVLSGSARRVAEFPCRMHSPNLRQRDFYEAEVLLARESVGGFAWRIRAIVPFNEMSTATLKTMSFPAHSGQKPI